MLKMFPIKLCSFDLFTIPWELWELGNKVMFNLNLNILERSYMELVLGEVPWCSNPKHIYSSHRLELFTYSFPFVIFILRR